MKVCPQCGSEYELDQRFCPKDGSSLRSQGGAGDLLGSVIAERYHVLKKLGEGGMGQVYLAEHVKMGRKSAVKVMHAAMNADPDAVSRFNREAANAARISHPNVCAIYDFGETPDGMIYLAMEFIEGKPLTDLIEQGGALPPVRAADITRQVASALGVAHDLGIVHRDLKPDNIMVSRTKDGADLVKVVDFGIAKASDNEAQKVTKTGLVVGTPEYMSPEQLAGDKLDGRSDIYSLGLVAFNCLTGTLPFQSNSAQEAMIMRLTDRPRTLAEVRPETAWPADLQQVMDRVLERDARDRYANATDFARDFSRAIEAMPAATTAEAGTVVVSAPKVGASEARTAAIPATRVAGPSDRAAAAPASAPAAAKTPAAAPAPAKSGGGMGMVIGGVALLAVAAGGYAMFGRGGQEAPPAAVVAQNPAPAPAEPTPTPASTDPAPTPGPTTAPTSSPTSAPAPVERAAPSTGGAAKPVGAELDRLIRLVEADDQAKAREALSGLADIESRLTGRDRVVGDYVKAAAYFQTDREARACELLRGIRDRAAGTKVAAQVEGFFGAGACPP